MQLISTDMAINAVSAALAKLNDNDALYRHDDLLIELSWMKCFLAALHDGQQPPPQQQRRTKIADVWSPIIERLALHALHSVGDYDDLCFKLSNLREKIRPFLSLSTPDMLAVDVKAASVPKKTIKVAAWGGPGGEKWKFHFDGILKQITVVNGEVIDSLTFTTLQADGSLKTLKVGGNGGITTNEVKINGASEKLRGIKGTYGFFGPDAVIKSMSFRTNLKTYGPYGKKEGVKFKYEVEDGGDILGFHGRFGFYLDAFGVYFQR